MTVQTSRKALTGTLVVSAFLSGGWLQAATANPLPLDSSAKDLQLDQFAEEGVTTASGVIVSTEDVLAETADVGYLIHQSTADNLTTAPEAIKITQATDESLTSTPVAIPQSAFIDAEGNVGLDASHLVPTSILPESSVHNMDWEYRAGSNSYPNFDATILPTTTQSEFESDVELAQDTTSDTFSPPSEEELRQRLLIDPNESIDVDAPRPVPSSSFLTPSAYGADWGDTFFGLAGAAGGNLRDIDGSASLGMGFGDAVRNVGVEVSASIISLDGFAEDGTVGFKLHKVFPQADNLAVAVGWANPISWGSANEDEEIFYGVATQRFALRPNQDNTMPLTVSAGVGTGTFRSSGAIAADDNDPNIFGSASIRVIPQLSLTSSWTGSGLGLAASAAPFNLPVIFTAGVSDLTDNTAEGTRFQGSMGYSFSF